METRTCPSVSVVVPVYQVEDYIGGCLASLAAQTLPPSEILFVDDCGTDGSIGLVRDFAGSHPELHCRVLSHQRNRGLSAARNTGLAAATGDYVLFLDSDDTLPPDALRDLTAPLASRPADFVIGNYASSGDDAMLRMPDGPCTDVLGTYAAGLWYVMAWNKLCNTGFLRENNLYFTEGLNHEDVIWTFRLACTARRMEVVTAVTYNYTVREASIMTGTSVAKDARLYVQVFDVVRQFITDRHLENNRDVYTLFEGKRCGIMYSLLDAGYAPLYRAVYPDIHRQCYIHPFRAFRNGFIGWGGLLRDLHYALPVGLGAGCKRLFYLCCYRWPHRPVRGRIWN